MKFRFAIVVLAISSLFAATLVSSSQAAGNPNCTEVDGDYIVTFTKGAVVSNEVKNINGKQVNPKYLYSEALNGFAGFLTGDQVCNLKKRGNVEDVELDQMAFASVSQPGATWGLDRIDQNLLPLNTQYSYVTTGTGVDAYVFDTGILGTHQEFRTRVRAGFTSISDSIGTTDCHGHGTHVAGTIGGSEYGVAKSVSLIPVRVLGCNGSGSISGIISGINWAIGHHVKGKAAVANFSLGGGVSKSLDSAVNNLIKDGVSVVVAAGNERANACNSSPARVPNAITVAASDSTDKLANFSNFGKCVDIIAPGVAIISSIHTSDTAAAAYSGTSMASPHVAGVVARLLSAGAAANSVLTSATTGRFTSLPSGTPNRLLYIDPSK
jgi:subtilisin family serine protease